MQFKSITAIIVLFLVVVSLSVSGCVNTPPVTTTATPTVSAKATATASAKPTAMPKPTATPKPSPTPLPISAILVERPASASGPDRTAEINKNMNEDYHRVTIDGHDAYAETEGVVNSYVFPFNSYGEAQTLHATLVAKFQANGFTVRSTTQDVWGPNSILTGLTRGSTQVTISASDSATISTLNILDTGSEVDILVDLSK